MKEGRIAGGSFEDCVVKKYVVYIEYREGLQNVRGETYSFDFVNGATDFMNQWLESRKDMPFTTDEAHGDVIACHWSDKCGITILSVTV